MRATGPRQAVVTAMGRAAAGCAAALLFSGSPLALDPERSIPQFYHTTWTVRDGIPGHVNAIAQTPDGFLWLGTASGLYTFDGVRAERFGPASLAGRTILALETDEAGDLWVGYDTPMITRVRGGEVTRFALPTSDIRSRIEYLEADPDGSIWVGTRDRVLNFDGRRWRAVRSPWPAASTWSNPGGVWGLALGRDGTLWAKNLLGLYYLRRGAAAFEPASGYAGGLIDFARDREGRLWTADFASRRFYALPDLRPGQPLPPPSPGAGVPPSILAKVVMDRDGTLWNANRVTGGLYRTASVTAPAAAERFTVSQGLTADYISQIFEDREGAIWVGAGPGLERFRPANIVFEPAIPIRPQAAALVPTGGALFAYSGMGASVPDPAEAGRRLYRVRPGQAPEVVDPDIGQVQAIGAAPGGDLVIASEGRLRRWRDGVFTAIATPPEIDGGHVVNLVAEDGGGLLVSVYGKGVHRFSGGRWTRIAPPSARPTDAPSVAIDGSGAAWLFYADGLIARSDGRRTMEFPLELTARLGRIAGAVADRDGFLLVGAAGIGRFDGRRLQVLPGSRAPFLTLPQGIVQTPDGDLWISVQRGIVRMEKAALLKAMSEPEAELQYRLFDIGDGFRGAPPGDTFNAAMAVGPDGRVWFITGAALAWIDPARLYRNPHPPPVVVGSVTAAGRRFFRPASLTLPAGTSQLQIDYTALSLAMPERVRFRYRLEGVDRDWVEAGERRQVFYTNLAPGAYRFQVIAANADGVWNTTGTTLAIRLLPAFSQTWAFKILVGLAALAGLWGLYRLRLRQVSDQIRARLAERMDERERIARELHDTLLQGVQGLTLKLQSYAEQMPANARARKLMEQALDSADQVIAEGRDRVRDLRASQSSGDLPEALDAAVYRLRIDPAVKVSIQVDGLRRPLHPVVFDEVMGIAGEALFNAFSHARAAQVWVEVRYERSQLAVRVRDDGVGIGNEVLEQGREGHFGLAGMRERTRKIHGQLVVRSGLAEGTDITLTVPAGHAYVRGRPWWWPTGALKTPASRSTE